MSIHFPLEFVSTSLQDQRDRTRDQSRALDGELAPREGLGCWMDLKCPVMREESTVHHRQYERLLAEKIVSDARLDEVEASHTMMVHDKCAMRRECGGLQVARNPRCRKSPRRGRQGFHR